MNNNPLDAFPYLQQMTQQFRQMFGDDFVKNLMNSMQMPMWNQNPGMPGNHSDPAFSGGQGNAGSRFGGESAASNSQGPMPGSGELPNWMGQWNPFSQGQPGVPGPSAQYPPVDVYETRHEVVIVLEVPGLERASDVRLSIFPDRVTVKGDRKRQYQRALDGQMVQAERTIGPFERTIPLPSRVRKQHAKATYAHGLLEIRLMKEGRSGDPDANIIDVDFL